MSEEEKKVKLDELPDEGSSVIFRPSPVKKSAKRAPPDPRITSLKDKKAPEKLQTMQQKWVFDEREKDFTWVVFVLILGVIQFSPFYQGYLSEVHLLNSSLFEGAGDQLRSEFLVYIEVFIRYPLVLVILTPFFFSFSQPSDYLFEITFDGIRTVKNFVPIGSKELVQKVSVKWNDIEKIEKVFIGKKEILRIHSLEGPVAELIWYIGIDKKRAIKLLLQGLIAQKHPLRMFLENEKDL